MRRWMMFIAILTLGVTLCVGCAGPAQGVKPEEFYKGKTITIIVNMRAGGSMDAMARVFARYLEVHTQAHVVVENKSAGGGMEGCNYLYGVAKPDGLTIGVVQAGEFLWPSELTNTPGVEYEMTKFEYIGALLQTTAFLAVKGDGPYTTVEDLKRGEGLLFTTGGPTDKSAIASSLVSYGLDLDAKIASGFRGLAPMLLAIQSGEATGISVSIAPLLPLIEKGEMKALIHVWPERHKTWPDIPSLGELVSGPKQEELKEWLSWLETCEPLPAARAILAPPGTPQDKVEFLRETFDDISGRADFQQEAGPLQSGFWLPEMARTGEETAKAVANLKEAAPLYLKLAELAQSYAP